MHYLLLTALAISSRSFYSIFIKVMSNKMQISPITQSFLVLILAGFLSLAIGPFISEYDFTALPSIWPLLLVLITSQAFGNVIFFKGLKDLDSGTSQIAFSSILIWGALLSLLFLGSSFSLYQIIGIILLLVSIFILNYSNKKISISHSFLLVMVSSLLFATFQVSSAEVSQTISTATYLVVMYFGSAFVLLATYAQKVIEDIKKIAREASWVKPLLASSITSLLQFVFVYFAYQAAPDRGVVILLLSTQVVFYFFL
jgi:drug/metabolite transporter (DMT)-like permease